MSLTNIERKTATGGFDDSIRLFLKNILFILTNSINQKLKIKLSSVIVVALCWVLAPVFILLFSVRVKGLFGGNNQDLPIDIVLYITLLIACVFIVLRETKLLFSECFTIYVNGFHELAYYDRVTGLFNRQELEKRLDFLVERNLIEKCALIMIDIDNFKYVNNSLGYKEGDCLLAEVGRRIQKHSISKYSLYRIDGDEFAVLLEEIDGNHEVKGLEKEIQESLKQGFVLKESCVYIAVSVGIAYGYDCNCSHDLLVNADIALGEAKESGKNRTLFYCEKMHEAVEERTEIEKHLHSALEHNELSLHYQPQLDLRTNRITGFEALLRWNSAELGAVAPQRFIPVAESTELIIPIGEWVLRTACQFAKRLQNHSQEEFNIAVNISMIQLHQEDFVEKVMEALEFTNLAPEYLELEITESILMESCQVIERKLKILREKGVKIALDDFGKGYSSLSYLKDLPITSLKIDKSFVDTLPNHHSSNFLIDVIIQIGEKMNLSVVAEGVEIQEQMDYLKKCNCTKMQGYLFSKPLPEQEAMKITLGTPRENIGKR